MTISISRPPQLFDSLPFGFAQVAVVPMPGGKTVHISGQVGWDANRQIVSTDDIGAQLRMALANVGHTLSPFGASLDDVAALRLYIRNTHMHEGAAIAATLKTVFGDNPPCTTWIGVSSLARDEFLIEVEPSVVFIPDRAGSAAE